MTITQESFLLPKRNLSDEAEEELYAAEKLTTEGLDTLILKADRKGGPHFVEHAYANGVVEADTLAALIGGVWSSAEFPDRLLDHDTWRWLFRVAQFTVDGVRAPRPDAPVELWRGSVPERRADWSWSTDRAVAERFAGGMRGREIGRLYRLLAPPEALLCANTGRGEAEYVVDTHGLVIEAAADG